MNVYLFYLISSVENYSSATFRTECSWEHILKILNAIYSIFLQENAVLLHFYIRVDFLFTYSFSIIIESLILARHVLMHFHVVTW
jgi:hypothetical protein